MTQQMIEKDTLSKLISDELYKALGFSKEIWLRRFVEPIVKNPVSRFAEICTSFEQIASREGLREAANRILPNFIKDLSIRGYEKVPREGSLLIVSNHPGTYDSLIIAGSIPRDDLKILAGNIPFLKIMPATQNSIIHTTADTHDRMTVLRKSYRHLKDGGSLLIFGSGGIDPEPNYMPGADAEIDRWSPSIEFFMKKIPQLNTLATIVSGVLSSKYTKHPLTLFRKSRRDKQRISEFMQVIQQMVFPGKLLLSPAVAFSDPLCPLDFPGVTDSQSVFQYLKMTAKQLLEDQTTSELSNC